MQDPVGRDATIVRKALSGDTINLKVATEVLCSRTPSQLQQLRGVYLTIFGAYLEHDIESQASGDHKKVITYPSISLSLLILFYCFELLL